MKYNYTHITMVIDKSGSMRGKETDVSGGFNKFITDQQKAEGDATLTLVEFADFYTKRFDFLDVKAIKPDYELCPGGSTALLDAIARAMFETGASLSAMPENKRPSKVLFIIFTDGEENSSRDNSFTDVQEMIKVQRENFNWEFLFFGADIDAIGTASKIGIGYGQTVQASKGKTGAVFSTASAATSNYRKTGLIQGAQGMTVQADYDQQENDKKV